MSKSNEPRDYVQEQNYKCLMYDKPYYILKKLWDSSDQTNHYESTTYDLQECFMKIIDPIDTKKSFCFSDVKTTCSGFVPSYSYNSRNSLLKNKKDRENCMCFEAIDDAKSLSTISCICYKDTWNNCYNNLKQKDCSFKRKECEVTQFNNYYNFTAKCQLSGTYISYEKRYFSNRRAKISPVKYRFNRSNRKYEILQTEKPTESSSTLIVESSTNLVPAVDKLQADDPFVAYQSNGITINSNSLQSFFTQYIFILIIYLFICNNLLGKNILIRKKKN